MSTSPSTNQNSDIEMKSSMSALKPEPSHPNAAESSANEIDDDMPVDELLRSLGTTEDQGLSDKEAEARLEEYGRNELERNESRPFWKLFLDQFKDLLVILLLIASIVAAAFGGYIEAGAIWAIVLAIAYVGAQQEGKADDAISALEDLSAPKTRVRRGGRLIEIETALLVPGDILDLHTGDRISADARVISSNDFSVDEASITGESVPVDKSAKASVDSSRADKGLTLANKVYMGTEIASGSATCVVVATGMKAEFIGKIVELLNSSGMGKSPLQEKLHNLGEQLGYASIAISLVVFVVGVSTGRGADPTSDQPVWLQMLLIAVSLTVAAVPEGLPVCVTITLAMGMNRMASRNALIRKLKSVETLGSANIIFSDKTGTLTVGKMAVTIVATSNNLGTYWRLTGQGYNPEGEILATSKKDATGQGSKDDGAEHKEEEKASEDRHDINTILQCAALSSNSELTFNESKDRWDITGNMTDRAIRVAARKGGFKAEETGQRLHENSFDSTRKMHSVIVTLKSSGKDYVVVKGAPDRVLDRCVSYASSYQDAFEYTASDMDDKTKEEFLDQVNLQSKKGGRCIAFGIRPSSSDSKEADDVEADLTYVGLFSIKDPPREEVTPAIEEAQSAGVRVVMITGDYKLTAAAIAQTVGIVPPELRNTEDIPTLVDEGLVVDCDEFRGWSDEKQENAVFNACVFARAKPEDKMTIIKHAQDPQFNGRRRMVCAMTGDGVNDAPAAKAADIGCAMGSGTPVCQSAADMILANDSFATIVEAIREGRRIYANISKFVYMLLSQNIAEVFLILGASILDLQSPLVPIQILWLNLMTDSLPALALATEAAEPSIMRTPPRLREQSLIDKLMITGVVIHNSVLVAVNLTTYIVGLQWHVGEWHGNLKCGDNKACEDAQQEGVRMAQTMVIYVIVFAELLRAYSARSLRESVFALGVFSNKWMQYSVGSAIAITFAIGHIPGLRQAFDMETLDGRSWLLIAAGSILPFVIDELVKMQYRATGYGLPPKIFREFGEAHAKKHN